MDDTFGHSANRLFSSRHAVPSNLRYAGSRTEYYVNNEEGEGKDLELLIIDIDELE